MATNIKAATIASTYDRLVLVQDGNDIGAGTDTMNIEIQTQAGVATATPLYISTNRIGIGIAAPEKLLHIYRENSTASASADTTVFIEHDDNNYLELAAPSAYNAGVLFTDLNGVRGKVDYDLNTRIFTLYNNPHGNTSGCWAFISGGTNSENVGINTSAPEGHLQIHDSVGSRTTTATSIDQGLVLSSTDVAYNDYYPAISWRNEDTSINSTEVDCAAIIVQAAEDSDGANKSGTNMRFYVHASNTDSDGLNAATEKLTILQSGYVGVGEVSPKKTLDVKGAVGILEGNTIDFHDGAASNSGRILCESSDIMTFYNTSGNTKRMSIIADGKVGIGAHTPDNLLHIQETTNNSGSINALDNSGLQIENTDTTTNSFAQLHLRVDTLDANIRIVDDGSLRFLLEDSYTTPALTILKAGNVGIGTIAPANPLAVNRSGDGVIVDFESADAVEGTVSISGATCSYNPFFGAHYTELTGGTDQSSLLVGTVLDSVDAMVENKFINGKRLPKCKVNTVADSSEVYGVYHCDVDDDDGVEAVEAVAAVEAVLDDDGNILEAAVAAVEAVEAVPATVIGLNSGGLGAYFIRIHKDVDVSIGDLLVSNGDGTAKKQDDDIIRSKTIGKVTSTTKKETYDDESYIVPCVLYCG